MFQGGTIRVDLERPENGNYGFSLVQGEKGSSTALYVRSVTPGTMAAERVQVGDRLLQVGSIYCIPIHLIYLNRSCKVLKCLDFIVSF